MKNFNIKFLIVALVSLLAFTSMALGQTETGQIVGTVVDQSGAVVSGATVEIKNVATTAIRNVTANGEGVFIATNLQPGSYEITVKSGSFKPATITVQLSVGGRSEPKITMTTSVAEEVTVTSGGIAEVNTSTQDVGNVVSQKQLIELPNLTRNPYGLVGLSGNVSTNDPSGRGVGVAINGLRAASTEVLLDGTSNVDAFVASVGQNVPLDSVQEFRVITSNFSAEYGRASGGIVNVSTKSGQNDFHGTLYEFNRISRLASNDYDSNANGIKKGQFTRNQFGYSVGGRIIKDKLFFFSSTEWIRVRSGGEVRQWVLDPAFLALTPGVGGVPAGFANTKAYFAAFGALASGVTVTGRKILATDIPALAALGAVPVLRQVSYTAAINQGAGTPQNGYLSNNRIDWNYSDKTQIYGRYSLEANDLANGTISRSPFADYNTGQHIFNNSFLVSGTHLFTPRFVSQTKINFNRLLTDQPLGPKGALPALYFINGGATTNFLAPGNVNRTGESIVNPGYLPTSPNTGIPFGGPQNFLQVYEDLSYTTGKHSLRFGGQYVNLRDNRTFGAYQTANELLTTSTSNYTTAFTNLLNGNIARLQVAVNAGGLFPGQAIPAGFAVSPPNFSRSNRYQEWAGYFNDAWRVTPRLTANLGVRYEYYGVQKNADTSLDSNFYYGTGSNIFQRIKNGRLDKADNHGGLWNPDRNNWAPRLGIAWDVFGNGKTSVRGGYALAYERNFGNVTFNVIQNPPAYAVVTYPTTIQTSNLPILGPPVGSGCAAANQFCPGRPLPPTSTRWVDENIKNAYAHQWSASFQHRLMRETTLSVEYTGSAGRKLYSLEDPNTLESAIAYGGMNGALSDPALAAANGCPPLYITAGATGTLSYFNTVSRLNCSYSNMNRRGNAGYSDYKAIIVSVESNNFMNTGLLFTSRYTYGVSKDNLSSTFSESGNNFNLGLLDPNKPELDYGYSDFDTRQRWVSSFVYEVPFGKNMDSWKKHLFSGWQISGQGSVESGSPFTIYDTTTGFFKARRLILNSANAVNFGAPNRLVPVAGQANQFTWNVIPLSAINTSYIPQAAAGVNTGDPCGTGLSNGLCTDDSATFPADMLPRNSFRGPGFWNVDLGVFKRVRLTEKYALQFRAEAFNVMNHANLFVDNGDVDVWDPNTGVQQTKTITASRFGRRNVQLAIKFIF